MNKSYISLTVIIFFIIGFSVSGFAKIMSVRIKPEKQKVLPAEVIDIEVNVVADKDNSETLYVETLYGEIVSDMTSESSDELGKIFYLGEGQKTLKFQYKAPAGCGDSIDFIAVWSVSLKEEENGKMSYKKIKELKSKKIILLHPNFAVINYYYLYHHKNLDSEDKREINIKLKLKLKSGGAQSLYKIEKIEILKANGYEMVKEGDTVEKADLVSINLSNASPVIQLSFDSKGEEITSVRFPVIHTSLNWIGQKSFVPEKTVNIGPVSEDNRRERDKMIRESSRKLRKKLSKKERRKIRFAAFMTFLSSMNPPDFNRKGGNGIRYVWGEGKYSKKITDGIIKKKYKWELFTDREIK